MPFARRRLAFVLGCALLVSLLTTFAVVWVAPTVQVHLAAVRGANNDSAALPPSLLDNPARLARGCGLYLRLPGVIASEPRKAYVVRVLLRRCGYSGAGHLAIVLLDSERLAAYAASALGDLGPEARASTRDILNAILTRPGWVRIEAARALRKIGPPVEDADAVLLQVLHDPETGSYERVPVARALWALTRGHEREVLPILLASFKNASLARKGDYIADKCLEMEAAEALGEMGPAALDAIPQLTTMTEDTVTEFYVQGYRETAREALRRITGRAPALKPLWPSRSGRPPKVNGQDEP
jgi:hypothetical protein